MFNYSFVVILLQLLMDLNPSQPPTLPYPLLPTPPNPNSISAECVRTSFAEMFPLLDSSHNLLKFDEEEFPP